MYLLLFNDQFIDYIYLQRFTFGWYYKYIILYHWKIHTNGGLSWKAKTDTAQREARVVLEGL